MKKYLLFALLFLLACSSQKPILVLDALNKAGILPMRYRSTKTPLNKQQVSTIGLSELQISGSAQFARDGLIKIKKTISPYTLWVFDLRQEAHGFVNGNAISWYSPRNNMNRRKSLEQIELDEKKRLQKLEQKKKILVRTSLQGTKFYHADLPMNDTILIDVQTVSTEKQLGKKQDIRVFRLPVTDHTRPTNEIVDRFIHIVRDLPSDVWIHFHCRGGSGRTTMFMILYDMMQNAKKVSMEDIINRQHLLGGSNIYKTKASVNWRTKLRKERFLFVQKFYEYCQENSDNFSTSWSFWLKKQEGKRSLSPSN